MHPEVKAAVQSVEEKLLSTADRLEQEAATLRALVADVRSKLEEDHDEREAGIPDDGLGTGDGYEAGGAGYDTDPGAEEDAGET